MLKTGIAKLLKDDGAQAVQLPPEFRFEGDEVYVSRDTNTGDVVLSSKQSTQTWNDFFKLMRSIDVPPDFMADRPMNVQPTKDRMIFGDGHAGDGSK